jgi:predicted TIM-barrel fold metal-dependent hydrolase
MKNGAFVLDAHTGFWDASQENCTNKYGEAFIETFYAFHNGFNPAGQPQWTMDYETRFRKVDPDWFLDTMFVQGDADMAILSTQVLSDFYDRGFCTADRNAQLKARAPQRLLALGAVDPRTPGAVDEITRQVEELGMDGFKWYTAEWRGESRGWKANDPAVFPLYERCIDLGITNMHFHKGPAVEPLAMERFDVRDIDEPSTLYPELNFIIDHCGLPRLDDFCWLSARSPNVFASLAVALAFVHNRPRYFAEVMANLLFWLGPDRIIYGTDFPIWYPHWQLDDLMAFALPADIAAEYGVTLDDETRQKIVGENIARLYGIDIPSRLGMLEGDAWSTAHADHLKGLTEAATPPAQDVGLAGTGTR